MRLAVLCCGCRANGVGEHFAYRKVTLFIRYNNTVSKLHVLSLIITQRILQLLFAEPIPHILRYLPVLWVKEVEAERWFFTSVKFIAFLLVAFTGSNVPRHQWLIKGRRRFRSLHQCSRYHGSAENIFSWVTFAGTNENSVRRPLRQPPPLKVKHTDLFRYS